MSQSNNKLEDFGVSADVAAIMSTNFKRVQRATELYKYIKNTPSTMIVGGTMTGKTHLLKEIFKNHSGSVIYVRSTATRWTACDRFTPINVGATTKTFRNITNWVAKRSHDIKRNDSYKTTRWVTIVFDDIQGLDKVADPKTKRSVYSEFNRLISMLGSASRHAKIRNVLLAQSHGSIDHEFRQQCGAVLFLLPIADAAREAIYKKYWRILPSERSLIQFERLSRYSYIFKYEAKTRFYYLHQ